MRIERIDTLLREKPTGRRICVAGWVRTRRDTGSFSFVEINDGSCLANLQLIADKNLPNYESEIVRLTAGCSVTVRGLHAESPAKGQSVEVQAEEIRIVGWADPEHYPLQKKRHSFEFLREIAHLRPRTNAIGAVSRIRSRLTYAVHQFFQERGFVQVHTPIITTSDCEGAGEMFQVTTGRELGCNGCFRRKGIFWPTGRPDRQRPAAGRGLCPGAWRCLYLRTDIQGGEFTHLSASVRILDDRAGDGLLRALLQC